MDTSPLPLSIFYLRWGSVIPASKFSFVREFVLALVASVFVAEETCGLPLSLVSLVSLIADGGGAQEGQGGWEPFGGRLDSRLGPRTSKPASRGGNQSSSSGGPLFSAGTSVGAWLESWDSASASTSDRRPRTAQEVRLN